MFSTSQNFKKFQSKTVESMDMEHREIDGQKHLHLYLHL